MSSSIKQFGLALLLIFITFSIYSHLLRNGFINYDDQGYVYSNPAVTKGFGIAGIQWAFTSTEQGNWHPLAWMSHMLDVSLYGLWPGGHHLTSLLFHFVNTLLILWIFFRLTGEFWPSYLLAALFAVHPMHIESVAWVAERKDVLSTFFFLLTILAYHDYVRHKQPWRMSIVVVLFALGLMAKPMIVTLPFALLLLDYWPLARFTPKAGNSDAAARHGGGALWAPPAKLWLEKAPLFILSGISCLVTIYAQAVSIAGIEFVSVGSRFVNAVAGYGQYLLKALCPLHLSVFHPLIPQTSAWPALLSGLVLLIVTILVWRNRSERYLFTGWFFFLGTLIPVIGLVQVGNQAMADRYTYIPYLGLFLMAVFGGGALQKRAASLKLACLVLSCAALAFFCYLTSHHVPRWKNSKTLFSYALSNMPANAEAWFHLGDAAMEDKDFAGAITQYLQGLKYSKADVKALNNLGTAYLFSNNLSEALKYYSAALRIYPAYAVAARNRDIVLRMMAANPPITH
jgi:protein O-mannosyl-transferase